jgi:hypothetical protein
MRASEQNFRKKKLQDNIIHNDARPSEDAADNARNRAAIIISGRLADHQPGRNTWEHGLAAIQPSQKEIL